MNQEQDVKEKFPDQRKLDIINFEIERNGEKVIRCLTDLTYEERSAILKASSKEELIKYRDSLLGSLTAISQVDAYSIPELQDIIELLSTVIRTMSDWYGISANENQ